MQIIRGQQQLVSWCKNLVLSVVLSLLVALFLIRLNILVLGGSSGFIELYAYGMFKIARVTGVSFSLRFSIFASIFVTTD